MKIESPTLVLVRGLPGSSKSTVARKYVEEQGYKWFEADMFMVDIFGNYEFDGRRLAECHGKCLKSATDALSAGHDVVVSNTFTRLWEMEPYLDLTPNLKIVECEARYESEHDIPYASMKRMAERWEKIILPT